jgi:hypothetical protein
MKTRSLNQWSIFKPPNVMEVCGLERYFNTNSCGEMCLLLDQPA